MSKRLKSNREGLEASDSLFSKDYILLMFTALCHAMMNQFFVTTTPLFVSKLGGTVLHAGLFSTVYSMFALATRPVSGVLSDKFGRTKQLIIGAAICSLCCVLYGVYSIIPVLLIFRGLQGIGFGMHSTCAGAAAADVLPKSRMSEGIGYFFMYATIAQAIGPAIALTIVEGDAISDYKTLFFLSAGLIFLCFISNFFISYERKRKKAALVAGASPAPAEEKQEESNAAEESAPLPKALFGFEYAVFAPATSLILLQIGISSIMVYLAPFARWKEFGNPSLFFVVCATGSFTSRMFFGRIADRRGSDIIIIPCMAVMIACLCMFPMVTSLPMLIALALPVGLAMGAVIPTFSSLLFKRCSPARRGTASGASLSAIDIGIAVGAPILGAIADSLDFGFIYWAAAIFIAVGLVFYMFVASDKRYNKRQINQV